MDASDPAADFPAAHSMDTEWFAVDEAGHVARFYSSEDGAVPVDAAVGLSPGEASFDLLLLHAAVIGHALAAGSYVDLAEEEAAAQGRLVLFADQFEPYADLVERGEAVVVRERDPVVLVTRGAVGAERLRALRARAGFRGALPEEVAYDLAGEVDGPGGLLRYAHEHGEDPGLYRRGPVPAAPLRLADLPAPLREAVGTLALPVNFTAVTEVHLADHLPPERAATWGDLPLRYPEGGAEQWAEEQRVPERRRASRAWILLAVALAAAAVLAVLR